MKLRSGVYTKAARLVAEGKVHFTCMAIFRVTRLGYYNALYREFYCPTASRPIARDHYWNKVATRQRQEIRILALLFMAQVARTEHVR